MKMSRTNRGTAAKKPKTPPPPRLRKRRNLMRYSSPLIAAGLVAGTGLMGIVAGNSHAVGMSESDDPAAPAAFARFQDLTQRGMQPWIAHFNEGTAHLTADDFFDARTSLETALEQVPEGVTDDQGEMDEDAPECLVRRNLSLSIEGLAQDSIDTDNVDGAMDYLVEAMDAIGQCTTFDDDEDEDDDDQEDDPGEDQDDESDDSQDDEDDGTDDDQDDDQGDGTGDDQNDDQGEGESDPESDGPASNDDIHQRQSEQHQDLEDQQNNGDDGDDDDSDDDDDNGDNDQDTDNELTEQEQELQELNEQAEQHQREQDSRGGSGYGGGENW